MANKVDVRVLKSKESLTNALIGLLKTKTFDEITISEICSNAKVNRNTFYSHFSDINSLFSELEGKYLESLRSIAEKERESGAEPFQLLLSVLNKMKEEKEKTCIILKVANGCEFLRMIVELTLQDIFSVSSSFSSESLISFISGGFSSLIYDWIKADFSEASCDIVNEIHHFSDVLLCAK